MSIYSEVLAKFSLRILTFVALGVIVVVGYSCLESQHAREKAIINAEANAKLADAARENGFTQGELIKARAAEKLLGKKLLTAYAAIKAKGGSLAQHSNTTVEVSDTVPGAVVPATPAGPASWQDEHHRFTLQLPAGPLQRRQSFGLEGVVVISADGSLTTARYDFKEFDPETHQEISTEGAKLETKFQYTQDQTPGPGPWHLRGVGGLDHTGSPAAGVQANPWKGLTVGLIGIYSPRNKEGRAALHLGWRIFSTTVAAGPYVGISTKGTLVGGVAATIEVTR